MLGTGAFVSVLYRRHEEDKEEEEEEEEEEENESARMAPPRTVRSSSEFESATADKPLALIEVFGWAGHSRYSSQVLQEVSAQFGRQMHVLRVEGSILPFDISIEATSQPLFCFAARHSSGKMEVMQLFKGVHKSLIMNYANDLCARHMSGQLMARLGTGATAMEDAQNEGNLAVAPRRRSLRQMKYEEC